MSYFFNISACLFLIILQTVIIPALTLLDRFYDLMIPFVVYLGLFRPVRESLPFVLLLGFVMDNLSGSPVGLYLTTYFWLFVGVKGIARLLQVKDRLLIIMLIVAVGVLVENLIFLGTLTILGPEQQLAGNAARTVVVQVLWALWTGPVFLMIFKNMQKKLDLGFRAIYARKGD
jgi:cell shape-determining protein MreD